MQVLKDSKVKFVSTVGVSLLTFFWICVWSSHSSGSFCLTLERKLKIPPGDFKPAKRVLLDAAGLCVLFCFPFLWFFELEGKVWATIFTGVQFPFHTLRALCGPHCPQLIYARPVPEVHLIVQPFDYSIRCTKWEQITPFLLSLY